MRGASSATITFPIRKSPWTTAFGSGSGIEAATRSASSGTGSSRVRFTSQSCCQRRTWRSR